MIYNLFNDEQKDSECTNEGRPVRANVCVRADVQCTMYMDSDQHFNNEKRID